MSDHSAPTIRKFNPGLLQSDEEIRKQFVVRHHELGLLLDELRGNIGSPSCQHILVVGPRGRGKTMLLARVAAELRSNQDFAGSLLPVRFMEESQEILSLTDFWLETMFHLANEVDEQDAELARELRDTRDALAPRWREQITEANARATVLDAADRLGKQLILIVENLQSLFRDTHDDFGWQLREVLQTEPQVILLGSATSRFRELDDVSEPFFEMFRIVGLEPLDTEECGRLWEGGERQAREPVRSQAAPDSHRRQSSLTGDGGRVRPASLPAPADVRAGHHDRRTHRVLPGSPGGPGEDGTEGVRGRDRPVAAVVGE